MNNKDNNLHQLYQSGDQAQPPKALDDAILARAEQAHQPTRLGRLRPWLAAASILFAIPILWLMLEQPELQQARQESLQPEPVPSAPMSVDSPKPDTKPSPSADDLYSQDQLTEQGKITVTGSRIKRQDPESDTAGLAAPATAEKKRAATQNLKKETRELSDLTAEHEPSAEENMRSSPVTYAPLHTAKQNTSESIINLISQLKPTELTVREQVLWQNLQQQINHQQWQHSLKTLKQLKKSHPDINFEPLNALLNNVPTD